LLSFLFLLSPIISNKAQSEVAFSYNQQCVEIHFKHLARLDFRYTAVGIFGKKAVRKSLEAFSADRDDSDFTTG